MRHGSDVTYIYISWRKNIEIFKEIKRKSLSQKLLFLHPFLELGSTNSLLVK